MFIFLAYTFSEKIEGQMADNESVPRFDMTAIRSKRKKVKCVKVLGGDEATDSKGSGGLM